MRCAWRKVFFLLMAMMLISCPVAAGQGASLKNIIITNTRDDLIVYLKVQGAFTEKIKKVILSGVPTTFSFFITLYRVRDLWFDKKIADLKLNHTIKYDSLKKEFTVIRPWMHDKPVVVKSFRKAQKLMADIDSLKVVSLNMLQKGTHYQLRAKAELSRRRLPFYLHYVLFFVSLWNFETDWYTIDFIY